MGFLDILGKVGKIAGIGASFAVPGLPAFVLPALMAGGGIASALSNTSGARTRSTTFQEPEEFSELSALLREQAAEKLRSPSALPEGFISSGISNINRGADLAEQSLSNRLTSRGLAGSPVEGAGLTNLEISRFGQINQLENVTAPLAEQDLQDRDFRNALSLFSRRPRADVEEVFPGSAAGAGMGTAIELLSRFIGRGDFDTGNRGAGNPLKPFGQLGLGNQTFV